MVSLLWARSAQVAWPERIRAAIGALIGLFCTVALARMLGELVGVNEWVMASLGASALLIFVLPSSPMAQPWAVIGGNGLSALVGITAYQLIPQSFICITSSCCKRHIGDVCVALSSSPCCCGGAHCCSWANY